MNTEAKPIIGDWYCHLDKGQRFQVVAIDETSGTVELQDFDGTLEEYDLEIWHEMDLAPCSAPESWAGAVDVGNKDDYGTEVTDTQGHDWNSAGDEFPLSSSLEEDEFPE
jgi:hypothetical protein